jgi:Zn-finger nucleic acid-binding protein
MKKAKLEGVLVDKCKVCGGIWLDAGELEMLKYDEGKSDDHLITEVRSELLEEKMRLITTLGLCPKCQEQQINKYNRSGVELDQCPACKGMFFDYGELDKVIKAEKNGIKDFFYGLKKTLKGH